jgi:mono/diheme cytochrome c family protein
MAMALNTFAAMASASASVDFVREVRPIFERHCLDCHGEDRQRSGLRLDVKAAALKGGEYHAPNIVPGNAGESPLMRFVSSEGDERMPPKGDGLTQAEIATLSRWIDEGANWPDGVDRVTLADPRDHWSFRPVARPEPPTTADETWGRNEVDRFVLARLEQAGLRPAPEADRASWLRRVSFDLTGLPPSPEEIDGFVNDPAEEAWERVVDALLASPRYGERWAQHWLDVVRYADTHGFEVNTERPHAWPYRDYVIRAFNDDRPYDRFVREQIAGDTLGEDAATGFLVTASVLLPGQIGQDEPSKRLARQDALDEIVVNLGQTFLGLSVGCARCHDHKFDPISAREYYAMQAFVAGVEYEDREMRTSDAEAKRREEAVLRTRATEIDQLLARFSPIARPRSEAPSPVSPPPEHDGSPASRSENEIVPLPLRPPVNARLNVDRFPPAKARHLRFTVLETNDLEPCLDELEVFDVSGVNVALPAMGTVATSSGDTVVADRHELRFLNDGHYGNSRSWMSNERGRGWVVMEFAQEQEIDRVVWGRDRESQFTDRLATRYRIEIAETSGEWRTVADSSDRDTATPDSKTTASVLAGLDGTEATEAAQLLDEKKSVERRIRKLTEGRLAFAGTFRAPDRIRLLHRGDPEQPREEIDPAVPSVLGTMTLPRDTEEAYRRRALADWIARPDNPLTARVMANRIWQGHFGIGLVDTPSDFGLNGSPPTHPELLDWLASEFIRTGWSVKRMHRLLVLSSTYRQSSRTGHLPPTPGAQQKSAQSLEPNPAASTLAGVQASRIDADVRLLWRFPSRRLEAESIRDAMLAVGGRLNLETGGRGFDLFDRRGGLTGFVPIESFAGDGLRRMIYAHKVRRERDGVFGAFDCPDAGQSTARRMESTTPIQALNLFNSRFTLEQSDAFAARVDAEAGEALEDRIRRAYRLALGREPIPEELAEAAPVLVEHGTTVLCRALFNSNEFLFLP